MSPPGFGRFSMARAVRAVEVLGFPGLIRGACSCTRMLWLADAILSWKSTVCFCPRLAEVDFFCCDSKRSASAFTEYVPGWSCGKLKRLESSVFTDRFRPVSTFMRSGARRVGKGGG